MRKKLIPYWLVLAFFILTGAGCSGGAKPAAQIESQQPPSTGPGPIKIVATIFPLADIAQNIGGTEAEVVTLLPPGSSPHTFEPTPGQIKQLANAQILIQVGAGLDSIAEKMALSANPDLIVVTAAHNLAAAADEQQQHSSPATHLHQDQHHQHQGPDPHVWLDPVLVQEHLVPMITAALTQVRPEQATKFNRLSQTYTQELEQLHQDISAATAGFTHRSFITFHSVWHYFALRYHLQDIAVESFPSKEPSAHWLTQVIKLAREQKAQAVLVEPQINAKAAQTIAQELNLPVLTVDPLGAHDKPGYDNYISIMQSNLEVMKQALH